MSHTRARLVRFLEEAYEPVTVAEIATALDLRENTVRHHLAALERAGRAETRVRRSGERGRPRLVFRSRPAPGGPYEALARALLRARTTGETLVEAGKAVAPAGKDLMGFLAAEGFDPRPTPDGLLLARCPLAEAVATDPAAVCAVHQGLVNVVAGRAGQTAVLRPARPGHCHVLVERGPDHVRRGND